MKILLVDKQTIRIDGLARLLTKSAHDLVEKAQTVHEALDYFSKTGFDILLADFNQIDDSDLALLQKIRKIYPNLKVVVLNMQEESSLVNELLQANARTATADTKARLALAEVLEALPASEVRLSGNLSKIIRNSLQATPEVNLLTAREQEILQLMAMGQTDAMMATTLGLNESTVATHRKNILRKTKTNSTAGLLKFAYANHLL